MNSLNKLVMPCSSVSQTRNWQYTISSFFSVFLVGLFILMNGSAEMYGQTFNTPGTSTFTVPAGVTSINVKAWGAGGGSGGTANATRSTNGGGGGAYSESTVAVTPGEMITVTVGAGGIGDVTAGGAGGTGGNSSFGTFVIAAGGTGGSGTNTAGLGGTAAASTGTIKFSGGNGGVRSNGGNGSGGGGGGSAGATGDGGSGGNAVTTTAGAAGTAGAGGGAAGGAGGISAANGADGAAPGGGGGGYGASGTTTGNGGNGQVVVTVLTIAGTPSHGSSCVGTASTPVTYTITNSGAFAVTGVTVTTNNAQFAVSGAPTTIPANGTATFSVTFTPSSVGAQNAIITVAATSISNTATINLSGTGNVVPTAPVVGTITNPSCGVNTASVDLSGLPAGSWTVTASPGGATITGSTTTATFGGLSPSTTYTFTVTNSVTCTSVASTSATIGASLDNTIGLTSAVSTDAQTVCISTPITPITYATTGATGATVTGLPAGVTGVFTGSSSAGMVTISGTPTNSGILPYTINLTGGCGSISATGSLTVTANNNTIGRTSAVSTDAQTVCISTLITPITYGTTGATGATVTGLPAGVSGEFSGNSTAGVVTISGTPSVAGPFTYTVNLVGGCGAATATGTITVSAATTISYASASFCATGTASVTQTGTSGGEYTALPAGLSINATTGAINLATSIAGTYTVSYEYMGTCASTVTTMVTVRALPVATLPSASTVCVGSPVTINSSITTTTPNYIHNWSVLGNVTNIVAGGTSALTASEVSFTTGALPETVTVTYNVTDGNGCASAPKSTTVTTIEAPRPTGAGDPQSQCADGTFTLTAQDIALQPAGSSGVWTIESGSGTLANPTSWNTATVTGVPGGTTTTVKWTVTSAACAATTSATTTLTNVSASLSSSLTPPAVCSGSSFTYTPTSATLGASFTWTRAAVAGISNAAASGSNGVSETLTNTTNTAVNVTYIYTTTANDCTGSPQNVVVSVKPTAQITAIAVNACSGDGFTVTPTNVTNGVVPSGTTYKWTAPVLSTPGSITGGVAQTTASPNIFGTTLTNTTNAVQTATYTVTPTTTTTGTACQGATFTVTVTVYPKPAITPTSMTATTCSGVEFTPITPVNGTNGTVPTGTTYTWLAPSVTGGMTGGVAQTTPSSSITGTLTNTGTTDETATYTVTPSVNGCSGAAFTVVVTVKPTPIFSSDASIDPICSGTAAVYTPISSPTGASFTWSRAFVTGITEPQTSGSGSVNEILTSTAVDQVTVTYAYIATANGCSSPAYNVTVNVYPKPVLSSSLTPAAICSGSTFTYTGTSATAVPSAPTITWTRAAVVGISNAEITAPQSGAVSEALINTTTAPITVTYVYTLSANGCTPNTQNVTVVVNPIPALTSTLTPSAICNATSFDYTPTSATTGATFAWSRAAVAGISNAAASGTGSVSEILNNTTALPVVVTYAITTTANSCSSTQNVTVTVNPTPSLSSALTIPAICSGTAAVYPAASATTGATFAWTRAAVTGITPATGSGTGNVNEILTNTSLAPITVTYLYTTTANGCSNTPQSVTVVVNPAVTLSSASTISAICSGTAAVYTPTSSPVGATFTWTRAAVTGITPATGSGSGNINEMLTNTTAAPISVTYAYILTLNGCSSTQNVTVMVNPKPNIADIDRTVCSGSPFAVLPPDVLADIVPTGTTYSWSAPTVTGGITGGVGGTNASIINGTLINPTTSVQTATYTVTPSTGGCAGPTFTLTITLNPTPTLTSVATTPICGGSTFAFTAASATSGATFAWTRAAVAGISNAAASGTGDVSEVLTNTTTSPIVVTYVYTTTANGCSNVQNVTVTVNPTPNVNHNYTAILCSGNAISPITPVDVMDGRIPAGTTYSWPGGSGSSFTTGILNNLGTSPTISTYSVTPTFGGCAGTAFNVAVTVNPIPAISGTLSVCKNATTTLTGNVAGGTWSSGSPTIATVNASGVVTGVAAGTADITYTANGCSTTVTVTVNATPQVLIQTASSTNFISNGCSLDFTATVTGGAAGPTSPNTWSVSNNTLLSLSSNTGLATTVTAIADGAPTNVFINFETSDANGCAAESPTFVIAVYPALVASIPAGPYNICLAPSAPATTSITLTPTITGGNPVGRTAPVWASSMESVATVDQSGVVTAVSAGTTNISVTVTDANGCSATSMQSVTVNAAPSFTTTVNQITCNGANDGIICLPIGIATTTWTKDGSPFAGSTGCNAGLLPGTYTIAITTTAGGCTQTLSPVTISEPAVISASIGGTTAVCQNGTAPSVTFTGVGGTGTFTGAGGTGMYTFTYTISDGTTTSTATTSSTAGFATKAVAADVATIGTFVYTLVSVSNGVCTKSVVGQSATITVGAAITGNTAGPDQTAITTSTATLAGSLGTATSGVWTVVPANPSITFADATSATTTVSGIVGAVTLRWTVTNGGCTVSDDVVITKTPVRVKIIAALEGPLVTATGRMVVDQTIFKPAILPALSPTAAALTGGSAIVDWITVELRTAATTVATGNYIKTNALINANGKIKEADGTTDLGFDVPEGSYYVVIKPRNHLGFRSATQVAIPVIPTPSDLTGEIDFATNRQSIYSSSSKLPYKIIGGVYCALAGNASTAITPGPFGALQFINATDNSIWQRTRFQEGYLPADYNMDGVVDSFDYTLWAGNNGTNEQY